MLDAGSCTARHFRPVPAGPAPAERDTPFTSTPDRTSLLATRLPTVPVTPTTTTLLICILLSLSGGRERVWTTDFDRLE